MSFHLLFPIGNSKYNPEGNIILFCCLWRYSSLRKIVQRCYSPIFIMTKMLSKVTIPKLIQQYPAVCGVKGNFISHLSFCCSFAPCLVSVPLVGQGSLFVGPLPRVRPRNGILALFFSSFLSLRSEFIGEL